MQHILVHSKMNGLRPLLTAPPVFAFRQLRGDSKKMTRKEIADEFEVTELRMRQIISKALRKIRKRANIKITKRQ